MNHAGGSFGVGVVTSLTARPPPSSGSCRAVSRLTPRHANHTICSSPNATAASCSGGTTEVRPTTLEGGHFVPEGEFRQRGERLWSHVVDPMERRSGDDRAGTAWSTGRSPVAGGPRSRIDEEEPVRVALLHFDGFPNYRHR
jgi:hypothetical protein